MIFRVFRLRGDNDEVNHFLINYVYNIGYITYHLVDDKTGILLRYLFLLKDQVEVKVYSIENFIVRRACVVLARARHWDCHQVHIGADAAWVSRRRHSPPASLLVRPGRQAFLRRRYENALLAFGLFSGHPRPTNA